MFLYMLKKRGLRLLLFFVLLVLGLALFGDISYGPLWYRVMRVFLGCVLFSFSMKNISQILCLTDGKVSRRKLVKVEYDSYELSQGLKDAGFKLLHSDGFYFLYSRNIVVSKNCLINLDDNEGSAYVSRYYESLAPIARLTAKQERAGRIILPALSHSEPAKILSLHSETFAEREVLGSCCDAYDDLFTNQSVGTIVTVFGKEIASTAVHVPSECSKQGRQIQPLCESKLSNGLRLVCLFVIEDGYKLNFIPQILKCSYDRSNVSLGAYFDAAICDLLGTMEVSYTITPLGYARIGHEGFAPAIGLEIKLKCGLEDILQKCGVSQIDNPFNPCCTLEEFETSGGIGWDDALLRVFLRKHEFGE